MLRLINREYKENINSRKKFSIFYGLICFWRVPKFRVSTYIRLMQNCKYRIIKEFIAKKLCLKYGLEIGIDTKIGNRFKIEHINGIVLGNGVVIKDNVTIYHNVTLGQRKGKYPKIFDDVTIYPNSIILGDVTIGRKSIILANSVVLIDIPENCLVAGNPAKIIKRLNQEDDYA